MRATRRTVDVSGLPDFAFGPQGMIWWGTVGFMVIEGSMFVMALISYFVFRTRVAEWPPALANPDARWGTINTIVLIASLIPNHLTKLAAEKFELRRVRVLLLVCLAFGIAFLVIRAFEFGSLNVSWQSAAYGSIVWFLMALHTTHLLFEVGEDAVITALLFTDHVEPKRFVDVSENAFYWYFVVLTWLPIYVTVYFAPRWL
jgi:heme/copper-type cytochrome/quinol oxidase subunit 3